MIIKNTGNKIISIGSNMLMPDSQIKVKAGMKKNPAIAALVEKGYIKLVDEEDDGKRASGKKDDAKAVPTENPVPEPDPDPEPEPETGKEEQPASEAEQSANGQDGDTKPEEGEDTAETEAPKRVKRNFKRTTTAAPAANPET